MDMMTVQQAAEKWGVSVRYVQILCKNGKLSGATKFGLNWMIPADTEKPKDKRCKPIKQTADRKPYITMPKQTPQIFMSDFYSKPGTADECVKSLSTNSETAMVFEGWLSFSRGDLTKALDIVLPLLDMQGDFYGTLNVGMLAMACAIWKNDAALWRKGRAHVSAVTCANEYERKIRDLWLGINDAGVLTKIQNLNWYSWSEFDKLPEDSLPAIWFHYAKHLHRIGTNLARGEATFPDIQGLGMLRMYPYLVEPLIAQVSRAGSLLAEICIRLLCADAYMNIGMDEAGLRHLDIALQLAVPDKLYGVLAEFRGMFNTVMDERLDRIDLEATKAVKKLYKDMLANWNEMSNRSVTLTLSERQNEIARLAALGLTNEEIAERLHVSFHTVKSTVSMIMNKTGTNKRSEFAKHIF